MEFKFESIGTIHSPFKKKEDIPRNGWSTPQGFNDITGELEITRDYENGLKDLKGFSHLVVSFVFHKSEGHKLLVKPFLDDVLRGVFATRSPNRPNPIGLTIVKLLKIRGPVLTVSGIDMLDGTPILDIKPYTPRDQKSEARFGWLENKINQ